jgi:hypothetical protein
MSFMLPVKKQQQMLSFIAVIMLQPYTQMIVFLPSNTVPKFPRGSRSGFLLSRGHKSVGKKYNANIL